MTLSSAPVAAPRPSVAGAGLFATAPKQTVLLSLVLVAAVLACYGTACRNGFLNYDDDRYITSNAHVRAGLTPATLSWAFRSYEEANWHPLTWLSHALDCQIFGLNPAGHHFFNVLLHAANAVLLFLLLLDATGRRWRSWMVAGLFALHPLNVESVAWAAERKNVLSLLFFLLALYAYRGYARHPEVRRYLFVVLLFSLSLLSKPQVIAFPFLLLLWDYWPLDRIRPLRGKSASGPATRLTLAPLVLEKLPLFALSAASAFVTMKAQKAGGAVQTLSQYSLLLRVETAGIAYVSYLKKALWPTKLVALYPHPTALYPVWQVVAAVFVLLLITGGVLLARERRYLAVGWFWFLGSLVPMIGLVQVGAQAMADRYAYLPCIGLFVMIAWAVGDEWKAHHLPGPGLAVLSASCLLLLGTAAHQQIAYWHDSPTFWLRTLALTENNYIAHDTYGDFLAGQGRMDEAADQFRAALAIRPDDLPANLNLGTYEHSHGNLPAAVERYHRVADLAADVPLRAAAYGNLGSAYRQMGKLAPAKQCFEEALRLAPNQPMSLVGLGLVAQKNGDAAEAVRQYSRAMAVQPTDVGFLLLAGAWQQQGRTEEARKSREKAASLTSNFAEAEATAASLLSAPGK